jgi:spore maturation protein B
MISTYGEDHILVKMVATMFGSTETTFYVIAVYFGAVNIRKTRHAVPAGLIADAAAFIFAVYLIKLLFG